MYRLFLPLAVLAVGSACTKYPYVALLEGEWVGTATDDAGIAYPMIANFTYDPEIERRFGGTVDINGWLYNVESVSSDKEQAQIDFANPLGVRDLLTEGVKVEEETSMAGKYTENTCYGQAAPCNVTGKFTLELQ